MLKREDRSVTWFEFEIFSSFPCLRHGVLSRFGGGKRESISSSIKQVLCLSDLLFMNQVHGNRVIRVDSHSSLSLTPCDGVMTNCKNLAIVGLHADCQVAIFYDPQKEAIAVVHAGWRGQVQEIYAECVQGMQREFGSRVSDIRVAISPSLGPDYSEFIHYKKELPETWHSFRKRECHFDLWEVSKWQLIQLGILPQHLQMAEICTYSTDVHYFSYRRDKGLLGHNATVACLT